MSRALLGLLGLGLAPGAIFACFPRRAALGLPVLTPAQRSSIAANLIRSLRQHLWHLHPPAFLSMATKQVSAGHMQNIAVRVFSAHTFTPTSIEVVNARFTADFSVSSRPGGPAG